MGRYSGFALGPSVFGPAVAPNASLISGVAGGTSLLSPPHSVTISFRHHLFMLLEGLYLSRNSVDK